MRCSTSIGFTAVLALCIDTLAGAVDAGTTSVEFDRRPPIPIRRQNEGLWVSVDWVRGPLSPGSATPRELSGGGLTSISRRVGVSGRASRRDDDRSAPDEGAAESVKPAFLSGASVWLGRRGTELLGKTSSLDLSEISVPVAVPIAGSAIRPPSKRLREHTARSAV
jgi:hypothetical protein